MGEIKASIKIDARKISQQISELRESFNFPVSSLENVPQHFIDLIFSHLRSLVDDIVISNVSTALDTGNTIVTVFSVEIGGEIERCATAIRAIELNIPTHKNIPN